MNDPQQISTLQIVGKSVLWASYETALAVLPVLVWGITLFSIGQDGEIWKLPAWSFLSVSIFVTILRDGLKAFHRESAKEDKLSRDVIVSFSLVGVVLSSVLLVLSVLHSQKLLPFLWPFFYEAVYSLLFGGLVFLFVVKSILFQRTEYGRYA
uniref:hypothetical protein n=1 Tax=Crenothrix polyspora TaxID=360316 RepID=UPI0015C6716A|nr:hypothetical protein [Crenothrix polyspora]